jgi:hypothetical protein
MYEMMRQGRPAASPVSAGNPKVIALMDQLDAITIDYLTPILDDFFKSDPLLAFLKK